MDEYEVARRKAQWHLQRWYNRDTVEAQDPDSEEES